MTHDEAVAISALSFATRNNMLFGGGEQFNFSEGHYWRLMVINAQCFKDWQAVTSGEQLQALKKDYPYISIVEIQEQLPVQGQAKTHGRKQKTKV